MVIIRRKPIRARILKAVSYGLVIATLGGLALWGYLKHRATPGRIEVTPPPVEGEPDFAGFDRRLVYANEQELLAPPAFPWSLAAVSRLPRAEVADVRITSFPEGEEPPPDLAEILAAGLAEQAPLVARPFTLAASPPYLITPLTVEMEFVLDEAGATTAVGVAGAPGDLNASFAERATRFLFEPEAAHANFLANVTLIPYPYDRLVASRGGKPLAVEEYRVLFRALQFNSFPLYDTCLAKAPELLTAETATGVSFAVDAEGHPGAPAFEPPLASEASQDALTATLTEIYLPASLAGARVEFLVGG